MTTKPTEGALQVALAWSYYSEKMGDKAKHTILANSEGMEIVKVNQLFQKYTQSPPPVIESIQNANILVSKLKVDFVDEIRHLVYRFFFPVQSQERAKIFSQRIDLFLNSVFTSEETISKAELIQKAKSLLKFPEREIVLKVLQKGIGEFSKKELLESILIRYQRIHPEDMEDIRSFFPNVSTSAALKLKRISKPDQVAKAFSAGVRDAKALGKKGEPELWRLFTEGGNWDAGVAIIDLITKRLGDQTKQFVLDDAERKYLSIAYNLGVEGADTLVDKLIVSNSSDRAYLRALKVNDPYYLSLNFTKGQLLPLENFEDEPMVDEIPDNFPWKEIPLEIALQRYKEIIRDLAEYDEQSRVIIYDAQDSAIVPKEVKARMTAKIAPVISKRELLRAALQYIDENVLKELEDVKGKIDSIHIENSKFPTAKEMILIIEMIKTFDLQKQKTVHLSEYSALEAQLLDLLNKVDDKKKARLSTSELLRRFLSKQSV